MGAITERIRPRFQTYQERSGATNRTRCLSHSSTPGLCGWGHSPIRAIVYAKEPDFWNKGCQVKSTDTGFRRCLLSRRGPEPTVCLCFFQGRNALAWAPIIPVFIDSTRRPPSSRFTKQPQTFRESLSDDMVPTVYNRPRGHNLGRHAKRTRQARPKSRQLRRLLRVRQSTGELHSRG